MSREKQNVMIMNAVGLPDATWTRTRRGPASGTSGAYHDKIVIENVTFAKVANHMGFRTTAKDTDLTVSGVPEDVDKAVQAAAETLVCTGISEEDIRNVNKLAGRHGDRLQVSGVHKPIPNTSGDFITCEFGRHQR